LIIIFGRTVI